MCSLVDIVDIVLNDLHVIQSNDLPGTHKKKKALDNNDDCLATPTTRLHGPRRCERDRRLPQHV
jgi:hypothetical protein